MPAISKGYQEHFDNSPNIIGSSEIPFGLRANVIKKRNGLSLEPNMTLLSGKMTHRTIQKAKVMYYITKEINKILGYTEIESNGKRFIELDNGNFFEFKVEKEKLFMIEFLPGRFIRLHLDDWTSLYTLEIKTTTLPTKMWAKELAIYQIEQLNTYLGFAHHSFGFLLKIDLNFYKSKSKRWAYIWNNYFLLYPFNFNQELFDYTLNRIKEYFSYIDNNTELSEIPCPEFPEFECKNDCREYCPNPIDKVKLDHNENCFCCEQEIRAGTTAFIRDNIMYHYTDEHGERYEDCILACKNAYRVAEDEDDHQSIADMMIDNGLSGGYD